MNLLGAILYDPPTAVNKLTTIAIAMTALDTTNLRIAFTVPPSGVVRVRLAGVLHGATTYPQIFLGCLEGSTIRGRQAPMKSGGNLSATALLSVVADYIVPGLSPGASLVWDAAYGVETVVALTGLKYGGPDNATVNNAWGAFSFEIWDAAPKLAIADAVWDEAIPGAYGAGTAGKILGDNIDATISSRSTYAGGAVASVTAAVTVGTNNDKAGYALTQTFPTNFAALAIAAGGLASADVRQVNGIDVKGAGTLADPWNPV